MDVDAIEDPMEAKGILAQIEHFGQTPSQLLKRAHPAREPVSKILEPLCSAPDQLSNLEIFTIGPKFFMFNKNWPHLPTTQSCVAHLSFQVGRPSCSSPVSLALRTPSTGEAEDCLVFVDVVSSSRSS